MSRPEELPENPTNGTPSTSGSHWHARPNADKISCPALLSFYNNDLLNPDENGNVSTAQLDDVLESVGLNSKVRGVLVKGADKTDEIPDSFNLFALRDSRLDHSGSTSIRDPEITPEKLEHALLKFSENGRMYAEHFAAAANYAQLQDPGFKGTMVQTLEFTAILEVFGRVDESKKRYLTIDDVKGLWMDGKFPQDWQPRNSDEIGVDDVVSGVTEMAVKRLLQLLKL
ncbi:MAG: hypothetical protein B0A82_11570 [Alkalinema sp. CACIAM 70d]|nr:MAG: hypothetical protein B0A82_11570 [Alkalinema sp. CACIAM 70d]